MRCSEICERYGIPYNTGPLHRQFGSVVRKIVKLALPPKLARGGPRLKPGTTTRSAPQRELTAA